MSDAATFRPRLSPLGVSAAMLTILAYFFIKLAIKDSVVNEYAFAIAAVVGLLRFVWRLPAQHLRQAIRVDASGIRDQDTGARFAWAEVSQLRVDIVDLALSPRRAIRVRIMSVVGPTGVIRFGDLGADAPARVQDVLNLDAAGLLAAVVAARTNSADLFPPTWRAEAGGPTPAAVSESAASLSERLQPRRSVGALALVFKLVPKAASMALKLLKTVKPGAALLTIAAYSLIFSPRFAVALVGMILVHECGHVFAMWRCGVAVRGIYFIPFVGGVAVSKGVAKTRAKTAYIAINGPVWGTLLALACLAGFSVSKGTAPLWGALAAWGALLNLFNLLPIFPLDGGRILASLANSIGGSRGVVVVFLSLVAGATLAYVAHFELLLLMGILGLFEFGGQLAALPFRPAMALIAPRPLEADEYEHFCRQVARVEMAALRRSSERRAAFERRKQEAMQTPMNGREAAAVLAGYLGLWVLLLGLMFATRELPGAGDPMGFLK